jgi:hypothetical protein
MKKNKTMSSYKFVLGQKQTDYKAELVKLQPQLNKAYVNYDSDKVNELRDLRKKYKNAIRKQLEQQIEALNVCPDEYEEYDHDKDKLSYQEAYLESMYNSGVPMNKCEQKALELVRGEL